MPRPSSSLFLLLLAACGARSDLDVSTARPPGVLSDAGVDAARSSEAGACVPAPEPTTLVSLENAATQGGASFSFTGDASRLYAFIFAEGTDNEQVLSVDPCTGATVVLGGVATYQSPLAAGGGAVYFEGMTTDGQADTLLASDPFGVSESVVATLAPAAYLSALTVAGGLVYAVTGDSALVAFPASGGAPTTLVPADPDNLIRVWWEGSAVDDAFVYFYGSNGIEKVAKGGGPTTTLYADGGDAACGGAEPPGDSIVLVDDAFVYMSGMNELRRVAKDGSVTMTYPGTASASCGPIALDDTYLYFTSAAGVSRVPKSGGAPTVLSPEPNASVGGIVVTADRIYWLDYTQAIVVLDKPS